MPSVLITGANRGLGLEFVRQYAAENWQVIATCRSPDRAVELAALGVEVHRLDLIDLGAVARLARELAGRPIDILINNAGVLSENQGFGHVDPDAWEREMRINALGPLKMAEAFLPHLEKGAAKTIACMSSRMGSVGDNTSGGYYAYRASKAALNAVVKSLSNDLRSHDIKVVALHPGWVRTRMGGPGATVAASESVTGLKRVIDRLSPGQSGHFYSYDGSEVPW